MCFCLICSLFFPWSGRYRSQGDPDQYVRYNTTVENVVFDEESKTFNVSSKARGHQESQVEQFDFVVVATGHFSVPHVPEINGLESFPGSVIHSKYMRNASRYAGKKVLLIGASFSALDLAIYCCKFGAMEVVISHRTAPLEFGWPSIVSEKPQVRSIDGNIVTFIDGTTDRFDDIVFCTGYLHSFPFMESKLHLNTKNLFFPNHLYKGVVFTEAGNNQLFYLGMQNQAYSFTMFDLQSVWVLKNIIGQLPVPSGDVAKDYCQKWMRR